MTEILIGKNAEGNPAVLLAALANRHGLITGATGTGKTVTLQTLAEGFAKLGVPVFTADVKGDLAGIARAGGANQKVAERVGQLGLQGYTNRAYPTIFWDIYGQQGHPARTTISEFGPILLAQLLELNDTQEGVLNIAFKIADEQGLLLLDLKDLRALLQHVSENAEEISSKYGNVASATVAAIQRSLLMIEQAGGEKFFGEPALQLEHLMQRDFSGNGVISVLDATTLIQSPRIYATFLLWLLSELFEELDEVGDQPLPRLVFFFDEAHLLFSQAPKSLLERIEQMVRLIRSKGVGVYFVTQHPLDVPESVLGQLGNRVQHALRAFTPRDQKAVKTAAETFRPNPNFKTEDVITQLGVGEALVSTLDAKGQPTVVERIFVAPPESRLGPLTPEERKESISRSPYAAIYKENIDRVSAYEILKARREQITTTNAEMKSEKAPAQPRPSNRQTAGEAFIKSVLRSVGSTLGREVFRGVLGSILGGRRR